MKKHFLSKLLTILLITSMILTMLPVSAMAYYGGNWNSLWESIWGGSDDETADEGSDEVDTYATSDNYRIVHLDCGRKYFSVDNIKKLIDTMADCGYNQLQLAFGNGGLRFALDDMTLSYGSFSETDTDGAVKNKIKAGNKAFNGDESYLTESDMNTIISYANKNGIEIVPMLNMPGHMEGILSSYTAYKDSKGNLDISKTKACDFAYALLSKYVNYFADKGCKYFHFGADESNHTGDNMTNFLTNCADIITKKINSKGENMIPRAFNDATKVAIMPKSVQITYWTLAMNYTTNQITSKTASELATDYSLINTHGRWYYVIKDYSATDNDSDKYSIGTYSTESNAKQVMVELPTLKATKMDGNYVGINQYFDSSSTPYGSTISGSLGTMFCIWCDASGNEYLTSDQVISENENYGALYQIKKLAEHYWPEDVTVPGSTVPTVSLQDGSPLPDSVAIGDELSLKASQSVVWTTTNSDVIDLSVPAQTRASKSIEGTEVTAVAKGAGRAEIQVSDAASGKTNSYLITVAQDATSQEVRLQIGEKRTFEVASSVKAGSYINGNEAYLATAEVAHVEGVTETTVSTTKATTLEDGASYIMRYAGSNYALTSNVGKTDWGTRTLAFETYTAAEDNNVWTLEASGTGYKLKSAAGYLSLGSENNTATVGTAGESFTLEYTDTGWTVKNSYGKYINALGGISSMTAGGWSEGNTRFDLYKVTSAAPSSSTLTITGTGENVDNEPLSVTVGNTTYNITVTAPKKEDTLALNYNKTKTFDGTVEILENKDDCVSLDGSTITAGTSNGQATVRVTQTNGGGYVTARTTYTVTVSDVDFSTVDDLKVELWCTNQPIGGIDKPADGTWYGLSILQPSGTYTDCTPAKMPIIASEAYGEDGILLSSQVIAEGRGYDNSGNRKDKDVYTYWKGTVLRDGLKQNHANYSGAEKVDRSEAGIDFEKVRYYEGRWWFLGSSDSQWYKVESDDTLIAYYMQKFVVSPEIDTTVRDWGEIAGKGGANWGASSGWVSGFVGVATAVVYEQDYSLSPNGDKEIYDNTLQMRAVGKVGVTPGVIGVSEPTDYRITKITITKGTHADANGNAKTTAVDWETTDTVNWNKKTNEAGTEWYDETVIWTPEGTNYTGGPVYLDKQVWNTYPDACTFTDNGKDKAFLILIYIEPIEKTDNLTVLYWDDTLNQQFNKNDIVVGAGVTFTTGLCSANDTAIGSNGPWDSNVKGNAKYLPDDAYVENTSGTKQTFNKDITIIQNLDAVYRSGIYEYVSAEIVDEGKTLKLHYKRNDELLKATYVLDFGLPVKIPMSDIITNTATLDNVTWNAQPQYGQLEYEPNKKVLIYTPTKVLTGLQSLNFNLIIGDKTEIAHIGVLPATNVLYEENFLTAANDSGWTKAGNTPTTEQETQKVNGGGSYNVFGYDNAYVKNGEQNVTGQLGVWSVKGLEAGKGLSGELTTEFYGNGFDLIGDCGPDTGRVLLLLTNKGTNKGKLLDIDTRYNDGKSQYGETTLHQVPLAHVMLDEGFYTAAIYAGGKTATTASAQSSTNGTAAYSGVAAYAAAMPVVSYDDDLYAVLAENGLTMADVEYVKVESAPVAAAPAPARRATSFYALDTVDATTAVERQAGTHVEIDSFRVYRSANDTNYPENEKNVTYTNVLDAFNEKFTAFVENSNGEWATRKAYESNGGPQNEIYLRKSDGTAGDAVAFSVGANETVQISARAVETGKTAKMVVNGGIPVGISSNTEMYYEVTAGNDGIITIKNTGEAMLALGNLKVKSTQTVAELSDEQIPMAIALLSMTPAPEEPEQPAAFTPEHFDAKVSATRLGRNKIVRLTVTTSSDVAKLTVNGKELRPVNSWLVKMGWSSSYTYILSEKMPRNDSRPFEIVCYNADGVASAAHVVTGQ